MPLIFLLDEIIIKTKNIRILILIFLLILVKIIIFDYQILFNPLSAPLPYADKQQYLNDWPAGWGIKEVVSYLEDTARKESIIVGTQGTFGLFPMALELYLGKNPRITFKAYWPLDEFPEELKNSALVRPTFLIFKEKQQAPENWPLALIKEYRRGNGGTYLKFYRVLP